MSDGEEEMSARERSAASTALAAYGERFMAMFDDDGGTAAAGHKGKRASGGGAEAARSAPHKKKRKVATGASPGGAGSSGGSGDGSRSSAAAGQASPQRAASRKAPPDAVAAAGATPPLAALKSRNEIEEIIFTGGRAAAAGGHGGAATPGSKAAQLQRQRMPASVDVKAERRAFMSHKAAKIHAAPAAGPSGRGAAAVDELRADLSPEDFKQLQLEVERLGASALDKKARKKWQAAFLERLGAKAEKAPRTNAKIGQGMAKKQAQRDARALSEAIATGQVRVKGMGKKKQQQRAKERDRGLMEAGPGFRGGVLNVKKMASDGGTGGGGRRSSR